MLLYNWDKIVKISKGNVGDIITILRIITYKIQPKNYYDKTFKFYKYKFWWEIISEESERFDGNWSVI